VDDGLAQGTLTGVVVWWDLGAIQEGEQSIPVLAIAVLQSLRVASGWRGGEQAVAGVLDVSHLTGEQLLVSASEIHCIVDYD